MTDAERAVIESAVDWEYCNVANEYGGAVAQLGKATAALRQAVSDLHGENDGRWK